MWIPPASKPQNYPNTRATIAELRENHDLCHKVIWIPQLTTELSEYHEHQYHRIMGIPPPPCCSRIMRIMKIPQKKPMWQSYMNTTTIIVELCKYANAIELFENYEQFRVMLTLSSPLQSCVNTCPTMDVYSQPYTCAGPTFTDSTNCGLKIERKTIKVMQINNIVTTIYTAFILY